MDPGRFIQLAGDQQHQESRQAGGNPARDVVHPGGEAPEIQVSFVAVADHRVQRIDHLVGHHAGHTEQSEPEEGRDDAVIQILGEGLKGGGADFLG